SAVFAVELLHAQEDGQGAVGDGLPRTHASGGAGAMKRVLNTLYVMTQGAYLRKEGEAVAVRVRRELRLRVPIIGISSIVCFGDTLLSPALMGHCAHNGVSISFMSAYGRFLARVQGPTTGNVLLRREQYRIADEKKRSA